MKRMLIASLLDLGCGHHQGMAGGAKGNGHDEQSKTFETLGPVIQQFVVTGVQPADPNRR
jgi:hypothetical protein